MSLITWPTRASCIRQGCVPRARRSCRRLGRTGRQPRPNRSTSRSGRHRLCPVKVNDSPGLSVLQGVKHGRPWDHMAPAWKFQAESSVSICWKQTTTSVEFGPLVNSAKSPVVLSLRALASPIGCLFPIHYGPVSIRIAAMRRAVSVKCRTSSGSMLRPRIFCSR